MGLFQTDSVALSYSNVEAARQGWIETFGCKAVEVPQNRDNPLPSDVALTLPGDSDARSTELIWDDNTTYKRFVHDLPIAARCVADNMAGPEIKVADTAFQYFSSCAPYKSSKVGTSRNDLDAPVVMDTGGNIGRVPTRILHYRYNCDGAYQNCADEEQFFLASGYGLWQWKHYQNSALVKSAMMNNITAGSASATLPCPQSFE
jgi:hypothetical protein